MKKILTGIFFFVGNALFIVWLLSNISCREKIEFIQSPSPKKNDLAIFASELDDFFTRSADKMGFYSEVSLFDLNGGFEFNKKYGLGPKEKSSSSDFLLASLSKPLTSIIIFQIIEEKKLNLDDKYCEKMAIPCSAFAKEIRVSQLLNHTSGLDRQAPNNHMFLSLRQFLPFGEKNRKITDLAMLADATVEKIHPSFGYSNYGFRLLSYLLEKIDRKPFAEIVDARLRKKYALSNVRLKNDFLDHNAQGVISVYNDSLVFRKALSKVIMAALPDTESFGAGSIIGNTTDLARLSKILLEKKLFGDVKTQSTMFQDAVNEYQFGWVRGEDTFGNKFCFHNGAKGPYLAHWFIFPEINFAAVVLSIFDLTSPYDEKYSEELQRFFLDKNYDRVLI